MPRWTVCVEPGCPELTYRTRCDECERARDKRRGSRQDRGYDARHDRERKKAERIVKRKGFTCWRCANYFPPGTPFDLGHHDTDRSVYLGPECVPCNRATAGRS